MRLVLFSSRRKADRSWLARVLSPLEQEHLDDIVLVLLYRPAEPLPVRRCLVLRPFIRPRRAVLDVAVEGRRGVPRPGGRRARVLSALDKRVRDRAPARWAGDRRLMVRTGAVGSPEVREEFARADYVAALDPTVTWAVWKLAQAIRGPQVVYGVEGVVRKARELRFAADNA